MKASDKRKTREWLWKRYKGRCFYCSQQLTKASMTIDHYKPKSLGGTNHRGNLRLACQSCNEDKAAKDPISDALSTGRTVCLLAGPEAGGGDQGRSADSRVDAEDMGTTIPSAPTPS